MTTPTPITLGETGLFDPSAPLTPSGNLRRRALVDRFVQVVATAAAVAAVAVLVIVLYGVVVRGAAALNLGFVFTNPQGLTSGGIANSLLGTLPEKVVVPAEEKAKALAERRRTIEAEPNRS